MNSPNNRIADLFQQFAIDFELLNIPLRGIVGVKIGIHHEDKVVYSIYKFHLNEDGYEYGAVIGKIEKDQVNDIAWKVLTSPPMPGITERIIDGKFTILGARDGLKDNDDIRVKNCFMDDIARIRSYIKNYGHFWK